MGQRNSSLEVLMIYSESVHVTGESDFIVPETVLLKG